MKKFISDIKTESTKLIQNSDDELNLKIEKIKKRVKKESLDNVIVDWFALIQEISYRKIGLKMVVKMKIMLFSPVNILIFFLFQALVKPSLDFSVARAFGTGAMRTCAKENKINLT
jgi:hypothetical protein